MVLGNPKLKSANSKEILGNELFAHCDKLYEHKDVIDRTGTRDRIQIVDKGPRRVGRPPSAPKSHFYGIAIAVRILLALSKIYKLSIPEVTRLAQLENLDDICGAGCDTTKGRFDKTLRLATKRIIRSDPKDRNTAFNWEDVARNGPTIVSHLEYLNNFAYRHGWNLRSWVTALIDHILNPPPKWEKPGKQAKRNTKKKSKSQKSTTPTTPPKNNKKRKAGPSIEVEEEAPPAPKKSRPVRACRLDSERSSVKVYNAPPPPSVAAAAVYSPLPVKSEPSYDFESDDELIDTKMDVGGSDSTIEDFEALLASISLSSPPSSSQPVVQSEAIEAPMAEHNEASIEEENEAPMEDYNDIIPDDFLPDGPLDSDQVEDFPSSLYEGYSGSLGGLLNSDPVVGFPSTLDEDYFGPWASLWDVDVDQMAM